RLEVRGEILGLDVDGLLDALEEVRDLLHLRRVRRELERAVQAGLRGVLLVEGPVRLRLPEPRGDRGAVEAEGLVEGLERLLRLLLLQIDLPLPDPGLRVVPLEGDRAVEQLEGGAPPPLPVQERALPVQGAGVRGVLAERAG